MASPAEEMLDAGFDALIAFHGERMTWRSGSGILRAEHGEVITTEVGKAVDLGDSTEPPAEEIEFIGIFDDQYQLETIAGTGFATTIDAVSVKTAALPDLERMDIIERGGVTYYVQDIQPDGIGASRLILSKQAH
jgi:hypothetical protein